MGGAGTEDALEPPADLAPARIAAALRTARYGRSLEVRARTGSTNDDARAAAEAGAPDGHVVVADAQTRGRGTHGRVWSSPPGLDLYLSVVCRSAFGPRALPLLTLAVGLAVAECVDACLVGAATAGAAPAGGVPWGSAPLAGGARVRWPNDVLLGDAKCAGVLVETSWLGDRLGPVVVGVGLDVGRLDFDASIDAPATSLTRATGRAFDRAAVLATLLGHLERRVDGLCAEGPAGVVAALEARLAWRGERVSCGGVTGVLLGVDGDGRLRLRADDGEHALIAGRVRRA
jgi:BirA family biotin operon repressor/biotin-[acetyl-CoA-carboxylase] ligase